MADSGQEARCQIYLAAPAHVDPERLGRLLDTGAVAAVLLYSDGGTPDQAVARAFVALAHGRGVPLLVADAPDIARAVGVDGVHIPANEARYQAARETLGADAMIGAGCGESRHDALVLAELGADYVAFGAEPGEDSAGEINELVAWWQEVCEPPVVGWHHGGWDEAAALIGAGADFIGVSTLIWNADDPDAALERLHRMTTELGKR